MDKNFVWESYKNDYYGISYPAQWKKNTLGSMAGFAPKEREELGFDISLFEVESLEQFGRGIEHLTLLKNQHQKLKEKTEVDGQPAYRLVWEEKEQESSEVKSEGMTYFIYKDGFMFKLEFSGQEEEYQNNIKIAERMLDSFELFTWEEEEAEEEIVEGELTAEQALEDARYLKNRLESVHPDIYFFRSQEQTEADFAAIEKEIKAGDSFSKRELYSILAPFVASFKEGHTYLRLGDVYENYTQSGGTVIPLLVKIENNRFKLLATAGSDSLPEGAEIISINGKKSLQIIADLKTMISCEEESWAENIIETQFPRYFWAKYGEQEEYVIEYKLKGEAVEETVISGVRAGVYALAQNNIALSDELVYDNWDLEHLENDISVLTIDNFTSQGLDSFIDSAFGALKGMEREVLIIDLRNNTGGKLSLVNHLFEYIYDSSFQVFKEQRIKLSEAIDYKERRFHPRLSQVEDMEDKVLKNLREKIKPEGKEARFEGPVYVLTDSATFSAAAIFADMVKSYEAGTLIGQPTGGPPNTHGNPISGQLPNSGLKITIANAFFLRTEESTTERGVQPDIELEFDGEKDREEVVKIIKEDIKK